MRLFLRRNPEDKPTKDLAPTSPTFAAPDSSPRAATANGTHYRLTQPSDTHVAQIVTELRAKLANDPQMQQDKARLEVPRRSVA